MTDEKMSLEDAVIGLQAYKEVDERIEQLWHNLDAAVVSPRMDAIRSNIPGIKVEGDVLELTGSADGSAESLLSDLERILTFISQKLPADLLQPLVNVMMNDIISKLTQEWLNPAVPSGLRDLDKFQALVSKMKDFCEELQRNGYTGLEQIQNWASKAPTIWLEKCRETSLNSVRVNLTGGIGQSKRVEKIERQMVSIAEGKELSRTGAGAVADTNDWGGDWGEDWDDDKANELATEANNQKEATGRDDDDTADAWGWDDNEDANKGAKMEEEPTQERAAEGEDGDDGADAWGWGDNDEANEDANQATEAKKAAETPDEDDGADAWGWGDDGDAAPAPAVPATAPTSAARKKRPSIAKGETRELIFKETYSISSMPEPVLELIFSILEDGAALTKDTDEYSLLTATAPGLFSLPTFVLALFRAISPHYYSSDAGGNM